MENQMTYKEREELKQLSQAVFGTTSYWQNKLMRRNPDLTTFEQVKARIEQIKVDTQKMLTTMKDSVDTNDISK